MPTWCKQCSSKLEIKPVFLATLSSKALFVSVALLLGSTLSGVLTQMGLNEFGIERLIVDGWLGMAYYYAARFAFSFFQRPTVVSLPNSEVTQSRHE